MTVNRLLVANRGEIAIRIFRAAADLDIATVAVHSEDDAHSLHLTHASAAVRLDGSGPAAYLDIDQIVAAAVDTGCDALHPGYGFLAENPALARRCAERDITFVGPTIDQLELFGDKVAARDAALRTGVPVLPGTDGAITKADAHEFLDSLGPGAAMMLKAVAGGGGRGTRAVSQAAEIDDAFERCTAEAGAAFGNGSLYAEQFIPHARHIEVQIIGDGSGEVAQLGERECSIQRRFQKVIEIAPAHNLNAAVRDQIIDSSVRLARTVRYRSLGTFEFLVDATEGSHVFAFIEANPRLQVEHTVTEAVTGIDLVQAQLQLAAGETLPGLALTQDRVPTARGVAIQTRVNMETLTADGATHPTGGTLTAFAPPLGPGVRTDTFGYVGYTTSPAFDSLLAKVIVHSSTDSFPRAVARTARALSEFQIDGVATNLPFLQNLLAHPDFAAGRIDTRFLDDHIVELVPDADAGAPQPQRFIAPDADSGGFAGARIDSADPLAVLDHGQTSPGAADASDSSSGLRQTVPSHAAPAAPIAGPAGSLPVLAPVQGTIVSLLVGEGDIVHQGQPIAIMEAMKMEHVIPADRSGYVRALAVTPGDTVFDGHPLLFIEAADVGDADRASAETVDPDHIRPDLQEVFDRHNLTLDAARPEAMRKRHDRGYRSVRENLEALIDPGSFIEYGSLVIAGRRLRSDLSDLIPDTPADGLVAGIGRVNGALFPDDTARTMVISYDYTVLAGTQGMKNHYKKDRMFDLADRCQLPVIVFAEGGGGRPGDSDNLTPAGLDVRAFTLWSQLSGRVPMIGIANGRCFAGNAAILGCCDVIIATAGSTIGMGGPAMIEGGGLGVFRPEEVGPMDVQVPNGVVDIAVQDEAEAVTVAQQYLSYFQGAVSEWEAPDARALRHIVPENRLRIYDMRQIIQGIADVGSVLEIRAGFGHGMITAFLRVEGRPLGVIANNPAHLAGAIDSDAADKAARFLQLCDAFDIPVLSLVDTPGMMVGPEVEKTALVRHCCRLFNTGANLTVPLFSIIVRKSYGLGAGAMVGGGSRQPFFTVTYPTAEFGGMGLEGQIKLGYRKELAAIQDLSERRAAYENMVAKAYENGKAINTASFFEVDDVIDPAESRRWISTALRSIPAPSPRNHKKRPNIDTW